jgi:hypothetical protein
MTTTLILNLFRRKMFFVLKYFQRNYFSAKMIFLKIFFGVWLLRKNYQRRKTTGEDPNKYHRTVIKVQVK